MYKSIFFSIYWYKIIRYKVGFWKEIIDFNWKIGEHKTVYYFKRNCFRRKFINLAVRNRNDKFDLRHDCYALTTTGAYIDNRSTVFTSREFSTKGSRPLFNEPYTLAGAIAFNLKDEDTLDSDR